MTWQPGWRGTLAIAFLSPFLAFTAETPPAAKAATSTAPDAIIELRGKLLPAPTPVRRALFRTESGDVYLLISNRLSSALFLDTNLQSKMLLLGGRVWPATRAFEVTRNLRSVRDGKVHELFYYCDICAITGADPGECMCCREPVLLVEEEAGSKSQKATSK